jgi:hypothetical protein
MFDFMAAFQQWNIVLSLLRLRIRIILFGSPVLDPDPVAIEMTNSDFFPHNFDPQTLLKRICGYRYFLSLDHITYVKKNALY